MTSGRQTVVIQGLGFVGAAMAVATAMARDAVGQPCFDVIGVDLATPEGMSRVADLAGGRFPFGTSDSSLLAAISEAHATGNLTATTEPGVYAKADIVIVDIHLDVDQTDTEHARVDFAPFKKAIRTLGDHIQPGTLVIVETTVPPGTCERIVQPELESAFARRGLSPNRVLLAHSYERVMPGADYLNSIRNFWRVYAGRSNAAADICESFLKKVIDTDRFPLTRLQTTAASELSKVLENAYRAVNIAFVEEWARLAERIGVDFYSVVDAIRMRPTHNNIRQPGFGVGGYCLTKDPLLAEVSAGQIFGFDDLSFPFSRAAIEINRLMPIETLNQIDALLNGVSGKVLLLLGVTYRQDVSDTRYSPSELFVRAAEARGARVVVQDPYVAHWSELDIPVLTGLPEPDGFDAVILAVPHKQYREADLAGWFGKAQALLFDANNVLDEATRSKIALQGGRMASIGRGASIQ